MRARNIKPGFFKNEILGAAEPLLSLLFEGLWLMADREGRLEDRPLRIKAEIFPYRESLDINGMLTELVRLDFICRYEVDGCAVILVKNFRKHQTPHKTERPSLLPVPPDNILKTMTTGSATVKPPNKDDRLTEPLPPDSLIPDSLIPDSLIPDSLIPDSSHPPIPEPTEPVTEQRDDFFAKCFEFITARFPQLVPSNSAPIYAWKQAGYDFETQVKPTVESTAAKAVKPKSFNYFTSILEELAAKKIAPAAPPERKLSAEEVEKNRKFIEKMGIVHATA